MGAREIWEWLNQTIREYCRECTETCCDCVRHKISVDFKELWPFIERDIPIYACDELDQASIANWYSNASARVLSRDGVEIPRPALIQAIQDLQEGAWSIYAEKYCPFFDESTKLCGVYLNPLRPRDCREYPFRLSVSDGDRTNPASKTYTLDIVETCMLHANADFINRLTIRFPEPAYSLSVMSIEADEETIA